MAEFGGRVPESEACGVGQAMVRRTTVILLRYCAAKH